MSAIVGACGVDPGRWREAAKDLMAARTAAAVNPDAGGQTGQQPMKLPDILIETAATRSPTEIAELVTNLKENGHPHFAARLIEAVARERTAEDVAALAIALLYSAPAADEPDTETPARKQEPTNWFPWRRREAS
ncbi:hypothetical protein ACVB8X_43835 [Streptomyces sp. NRAIS4]